MHILNNSRCDSEYTGVLQHVQRYQMSDTSTVVTDLFSCYPESEGSTILLVYWFLQFKLV